MPGNDLSRLIENLFVGRISTSETKFLFIIMRTNINWGSQELIYRKFRELEVD